MPAQKIYRRVDLRSFVAGSEIVMDVPRINDLEWLQIVLSGSVVITGAATSVPFDSPCGLIQQVQLLANGKEVLEHLPFVFSVVGNYGRNWSQERTAPGTTVATHPFRAVGFLDRGNMLGVRPKDSWFQAYLTNLLQLRLTTGQLSNILTGGTATLGATTVEVLAQSWLDSDKGEPKLVKRRTLQTAQFTGANTNLRIKLPLGNLIRSITVLARDTASAVPSNTMINTMQLALNGTDVRALGSFLSFRSVNQSDVPQGTTIPTGFAVIDASREGKASNFFDARAASECELVIDHNAPTTSGQIDLVVEEYIG